MSLTIALAQVNPADPAASPILTKSVTPHGTATEAPFKTRGHPAYQTLEVWARFARAPAKWFIRRLAGYLVETRIPDLNSGLRAFRADVGRQFLHLLPPGFSCVTREKRGAKQHHTRTKEA